MNKLCARCEKPVYFAERKTSLGREWHPSCLKCNECGRVLAPGQHAEHKGLPYCHHPCYRALFGPAIIGFGCTVSQTNKSRPYSCSLDYYDHNIPHHPNGDDSSIADNRNDHINMGGIIASTTTTTTTAAATNVPSAAGIYTASDVDIATTTTATKTVNAAMSSYETLHSRLKLDHVLEKAEYSKINNVNISVSDNNNSPIVDHSVDFIPAGDSSRPTALSSKLIEKVDIFNQYHQSKVHNQMTALQQADGSVKVRGPLRIYWGLSRPIQLSHCDDKPAAPVSKWRHSLHVGKKMTEIPERKIVSSMSMRRPLSPTNKSKELDDIFPPSSPDDVVRRKKRVPKFKTVAYRGDEPTKWKRASINGHIFNYDTSVFTPVLGSCTSVVVDDKMDSMSVIETLLDKFKVQNSAEEYVLSLVKEDGERLLTNFDRPLLERLKLGPQETLGKLFIKERQMETAVLPEDTHIQIPILEAAEEENLPHEVEQLLVLPEAVLRGILVKFKKDEEHDIQLVRARYEAARKRVLHQLGETSYKTSSTV